MDVLELIQYHKTKYSETGSCKFTGELHDSSGRREEKWASGRVLLVCGIPAVP